MLIYNFQKEFLGIDEKDLHTLGYNNLTELRSEVSDFADLFVKTPGYIHNFQHVHWIDFIACADSAEENKVIISANSKTYRATVSISNAYLVDNPNQKAYLVYLNNLRALTSQENENISEDITQRPVTATTVPQQTQTITPIKEEKAVVVDEYDTPLSVEEDLDQMLDVGDLSVTEEVQEPILQEVPKQQKAPKKPYVAPKKEVAAKKNASVETPKSAYVFDPHVASKELGLPLDLIEEFIQDFIDQANDFKNGLYTSLDNGDIDNVKILSHKLKGVAANLRIEDAHEVLSIINAASDVEIIKTNLDDFYKIITKLAGEEPVEQVETLGIITDEQVPQKIDIPELSDDEFIAPQEETDNQHEELLTFKDDEPELTLDFKEDQEPEAESEEEQTLEPEPTPEIQNEETYSKEQIANEIGLDINSFNELFDDFIKEAHAIFAKIKDAVATNDYETSKRQALKLKGMSDNMRMHGFTNELETLIHSTNKEAIAQAITEIDNVLTTISKEED